MTHEEDDDTLRCVVASAAGCVPVIAGTGSNCTQTMVEKSLRAQELGADGLLLITPYYNKANQEGMYRHFAAVADAVTIPSILYNVPGRTGCAIAPETVERLAKHPNVCGIKEASGDMSYAMRIAHCVGPDFRPLVRQRRHHPAPAVHRRQRRHLCVGQHHAPGVPPDGHGLPGGAAGGGPGNSPAVSGPDERHVHGGEPHPRQDRPEHDGAGTWGPSGCPCGT